MFLIALFGFVAIANGLPAQQILGPAATLTAIPATNHILILTPQAQVQLEPSLKYAQPIVQHLAPVARIDSPLDQTVVYVPNDNIINAAAAVHQGKQLETSNITNVINQFVNAGQTVQAELQALQNQLSQGLEGIITPGQKAEGSAAVPLDAPKPVAQLSETPRQDSGRFFSVPAGIPQFYSNIEVIHTPLNPLFAIQPIQTIRARSVVHPEDKANANVAALQEKTEPLNLAKKTEEGGAEQKAQGNENQNQARNTENAELATVQASQADNFDDKSLKVQKENEQAPSNSQFGKFLGSIEKRIASPEAPLESNLKDAKVTESKEPGSQGVSIAEALPAGLAISGEGGLAQARPIASAITGKDGIAYSAPSGTAISGTSDTEKASKSS
ncbi:uncharacterized protein LOC129946936 [Eupeodes corollae]|uniref:uncharacterized protein LOC129946936 n=1 Tax=Eupeodes corollae TaxID=290404 RepID=UPI0024939BA3|nr:uncharacterized protein LOC129946936 [Eupeodes corollae]